MKTTLVFMVIAVIGCVARPHFNQRIRNFWEHLQRNSFQDEANNVRPKEYRENNELSLEQELLNNLFPREITTAPETEKPVTEAPETEEPETEAPEAEEPKSEEPETEKPVTEAPETEEPETEAPETEEPETEAPETEAPETEAPETEAPETEEPETEAPETEEPETEAPETEEPETEESETEEPETEEQETEAPETEEPETEAPETEEPETEAPETEEPETEEPETEEPETKQPETEQPETEEPETEEPETEELETEEPETKEPETEEPGTEESETEEPETEKQETEEPETEEPETEEQKTEEPKTEEPETEEPETEEPETEEPETEEPETEEPETEEPETGTVPSDIFTSTGNYALWVFNGDWSETVVGEFTAGKSVMIAYDASRLPGRDTRYGQRAWSISLEYKFDHGQVHSQELKGPAIIGGQEIMATKIFLPFGASRLTVWFEHWGYYSGYSYDSDYGKNYEHEIVQPKEATLIFKRDYTEHKYGGPLEQGGQFQVYYSDKRLDVSDGFKLYAAAQFKANSEVNEVQQLTNRAGSYYIADFDISEDAEEVIMWFYTEKGDERHYDSNFGADYHFSLDA